MNSDAIPKLYAPKEERLNILTHAAGAAMMPFALMLMLHYAKGTMQSIACILYIISLTAMYTGSACYHAAKNPRRRFFLRKCDHAAIYFLIAGTYTPLMLTTCCTPKGITVLIAVWLIAVTGMSMEFVRKQKIRGLSIVLYLIGGWLCLSCFDELLQGLSRTGLFFLVAGGIAYTAGVFFYVSKKLYSHAIWHLFVIAGTFFHYCALLSMLMP